MNRINIKDRSCLIWHRMPFYLALLLYLNLVGCTNEVLNEFSRLETKALKYGTVSVGAVRVMDYNDCHLRKSRIKLQEALDNIHNELKSGPKPPPVTANPNKEPEKVTKK